MKLYFLEPELASGRPGTQIWGSLDGKL